MKKHRGLILGLGLAALLGLSAREAHAGNVTITVSWGANSIVIDYLSPEAQAGSTANNLTVDVGTLNGELTGSAYNFVDLGASSNNPGDAGGATISETGTVQQVASGAGGNTGITITVSQDGFKAPTGLGTLNSASGGTYTDATVGDTTTVFSSLNASSTTPNIYTVTGASNPEAYSGNASLGGLSAPSSYTLGNSVAISMAASTGAKDQFSVSATFNAVPEPASIVMMVTGMPLPLVVMGLLRRRRAAA